VNVIELVEVVEVVVLRRLENPPNRGEEPPAKGHFVAHFVAREKHQKYKCLKRWSEWQDSNLRPLRPERSALPG
jgi:hypothetical protein